MKLWLMLLSLVSVLLGAAWAQGRALIEPDLASEMAGLGSGEKVGVTIALTSQADPRSLESLAAEKSRSERRVLVVQALKSFSAKVQERVLSELRLGEVRGEVSDIQPFWLCNAVSCRVTKGEIERITELPEVWFVEKSEIVSKDILGKEERAGVEFTPLPVLEWHIRRIGADSVWNLLGITGQGVVVGHIDTGVNYNHVDLASHLWTDPNYPHHGWNFELNNDDPIDVQGHGTFMAGLVASDGRAGDTCGVAPRAQIMPCRVAPRGDTLGENQVFAAMQFCIAPPLSPNHGADVVLLPIGWDHSLSPRRSLWRQNLDNLSAAGLLLVTASGGFNQPPPDAVSTPGDCPGPWPHPANQSGGLSGALAVGTTQVNDSIASWSGRGPVTWQNVSPYFDYPYNPGPGLIKPDLCAPGVNLTSLSYTNNTSYVSGWSGTSLSSGLVAGVAALMLERNPGLTPRQADSLLEMTVKPLGTPPKNNTYGTGRVSAYGAVWNTPSGVDIQPALNHLPKRAFLGPAVPDPSRGQVTVSYDLSVETQVSLKVYNLSGQLVRTLVSGKEKAGYKHATWDGRSECGARMTSGVYFYRLEAGSFAATKKMIVVR
jgi:subtilisin family serine protease